MADWDVQRNLFGVAILGLPRTTHSRFCANGPRTSRHQQGSPKGHAAPSGALFDILCIPQGVRFCLKRLKTRTRKVEYWKTQCQRLGHLAQQDVYRRPGVGCTGVTTPKFVKARNRGGHKKPVIHHTNVKSPWYCVPTTLSCAVICRGSRKLESLLLRSGGNCTEAEI